MATYDGHFYEAQREGSRRSARRIVPMVLELIQPKSVIDVGCGVGTWLAVFRELGVANTWGVDTDGVAGLLEIPSDCFLVRDLSLRLDLARQVDLVVCLEVAEHLPPESGEVLVDSLAALGHVILFSAAIPFQGGTHHVNEQWPDYWAGLFDRRGFAVADAIRPRVWRDPDVDWWYAQNALLYVRRDHLRSYPRLTAALEATDSERLSLVHPCKYLDLIDWMRHVELARRDIATLVPSGASFIYVDLEQLEAALPPARRPIPFLERDGQYWGPPPDDATAITELERLRRNGAGFILFAWPAFWWLDQYVGLRRHLEGFPRVADNERIVAFDLRTGHGGQA